MILRNRLIGERRLTSQRLLEPFPQTLNPTSCVGAFDIREWDAAQPLGVVLGPSQHAQHPT